MPFLRGIARAIVLAAILLLPCACVADTGGVRLQAQDTPGDHPPSANGTVAELREQLNSDDPVIRSAAAGSLIQMQTKEAQQAIEEVLLRGKEPSVLDLLKVIGARKDLRLLPAVVQRLRGTTDGIVEATFACLEAFDRDRVADEVIPHLDRTDLKVEETARLVDALGRTRHRKAVPRLISLFSNTDTVVHDRVVAALLLVTGHRFPTTEVWKTWWAGAQAQTREEWLEEPILHAQGDPESDIGAELARTKIDFLTLRLSLVPPDQPEARLALVREAMEYKHAPQVRAFGAAEAAKLSPTERVKALTPLLLLCQDPDEEARAAALEAIGEIAGAAEATAQTRGEAAAALGPAAAGGPSARVRIAAIHGLAKLPASLSVERIRPALKDSDRSVRVAAVEALGLIESDEGVQELIDLLPKTKDDPDLRKAVVDAMGDSGASGVVTPLVALLEEAEGDEARPLRWSIANSLSKIKTTSKTAIATLHKLAAEDRFLDVRVKAIQGLGASKQVSEAAFLTGILLGTGDPKERSAAALALGLIGDPSAIPDLLSALPGGAPLAADAWKGVLLIVGTDRLRALDVSRRLMEAQDWARTAELLEPVASDTEFAATSPVLAEEARDRLGVALLGTGRLADALPFLKESAERKGATPEARLRYISALSDLAHHAEALALVAQWLAAEPAGSPFSWQLRLERVRIQVESKEFDQGAIDAERLAAEMGASQAIRDEAVRLREVCRAAIEASIREESVPMRKVEEVLREVARPEGRATAMEQFGRWGRKAVPALLVLAGGSETSRWGPASEALGAITGVSRPLTAESTPEERKEAVAAWRAWYDRE